ncbi:AAA family ATPase [Deinococcus sp. KNUC1210]|uniref:AAA family ATPase n=1 Tax=Deinococcus sp. KNUC1210 TaxID=2917691 RepID=UPI001EF10DD6|nr:AAA family ATPase [Deinococcus sp. KNUC1210]ULH16133.1 AAA family ATPase [Deinococcus sp. KNUC1210]
MQRILITGMSGAGKSSVCLELGRRGLDAVDTDTDAWCEWVGEPPDWQWREPELLRLLRTPRTRSLAVSGCKTNQGMFYAYFDQIVLLSAPLDVLLERVAARTDNPYGKAAHEREEIVRYFQTVEPLLRRGATAEFDTSILSVSQVADRILGQLSG